MVGTFQVTLRSSTDGEDPAGITAILTATNTSRSKTPTKGAIESLVSHTAEATISLFE